MQIVSDVLQSPEHMNFNGPAHVSNANSARNDLATKGVKDRLSKVGEARDRGGRVKVTSSIIKGAKHCMPALPISPPKLIRQAAAAQFPRIRSLSDRCSVVHSPSYKHWKNPYKAGIYRDTAPQTRAQTLGLKPQSVEKGACVGQRAS